MSLRSLRLYRKILRLARQWPRIAGSTPNVLNEQAFIRDEARFVSSRKRLKRCKGVVPHELFAEGSYSNQQSRCHC
jgi:hypothetical protein